jgi:hypothetical protein
MYALIRSFPPSSGAEVPVGTSVASRPVTVNYYDASGNMQSLDGTSVLADGDDIQVTVVDKDTKQARLEPMRVYTQLRVTNVDLSDSANQSDPMFAEFQDALQRGL